MTPLESKNFIWHLIFLGILWFAVGILSTASSVGQMLAFIEIFLYSTLDLVFLILLFWRIIFTPPEQAGRKFWIVFFLTFKLVCLGFLAITLKRLRNASLVAILLGIGFVFVGPFLAGVIKINRKGTLT